MNNEKKKFFLLNWNFFEKDFPSDITNILKKTKINSEVFDEYFDILLNVLNFEYSSKYIFLTKEQNEKENGNEKENVKKSEVERIPEEISQKKKKNLNLNLNLNILKIFFFIWKKENLLIKVDDDKKVKKLYKSFEKMGEG